MYIACPKCDWRPQPSDQWQCTCGKSWHTFETHGVCPRCGKVWKETRCMGAYAGGCSQWSDHEDWYHSDDDMTIEEVIEHGLPLRIENPVQ